MCKNKSIRDSIVDVENAENLEELKKAIVDVVKAIDGEISYVYEEVYVK